MLSNWNGFSPKWWQWVVSGAMVVAGVALVATGVGGPAGGTLICAGVNSIAGSYISEASGGSSVAGWVGGMITGSVSGLGASIAGNLLTRAAGVTGASCIGILAEAEAIAFFTGAAGSLAGEFAAAVIDGEK